MPISADGGFSWILLYHTTSFKQDLPRPQNQVTAHLSPSLPLFLFHHLLLGYCDNCPTCRLLGPVAHSRDSAPQPGVHLKITSLPCWLPSDTFQSQADELKSSPWPEGPQSGSLSLSPPSVPSWTLHPFQPHRPPRSVWDVHTPRNLSHLLSSAWNILP